MAYIPANNDHAVVAVGFAVTFERPFSEPDVQSLYASYPKWHAALPAIVPSSGHSVELVPGDAAPRVKPLPGVSFSYLQPDGSPSWEMTANGNALIVVCRLYSRWGQVWGKARTLLTDALAALRAVDASRRTKELTLEVDDSFKSSDASPATFLRPDCKWLSPAFWQEPGLWHQHSGWFSNWPPPEKLLNQLQIDVTPQQDGRLLRLVHRQIIRFETMQSLADLGESTIDLAMGKLHLNNTALLRELLTSEMLTRIGLQNDGSRRSS